MWYLLVFCLIVYLCCSLWFLLSSALQLDLLLKARKYTPPVFPVEASPLPRITIQVPVFNERFVISRLLDSLADFDYPGHLLDIQVLDDSTDDTSHIIETAVDRIRESGLQVTILQRIDRTGYKAGALQAGLPYCKGSLIALFDSDFTPAPDFLRSVIPHFDEPSTGAVQTRWQHRNLYQNWLTVIQSFLLDSHFTIEQKGRQAAGYFVNFCGTAGIWRKSCIEAVGGWNGDVLTEDLELSYRVQLNGWQIVYDPLIVVASDLPVEPGAFKVQQFRWAKGIAQVASQHLRSVAGKTIPALKKIHAFYHLLGSASFIAILGNVLLTLPVLAGRHVSASFASLSGWIMLTGITLPMLCIFYYSGTKRTLSGRNFWLHLPVFLVVYMGMCVQNSVAVVQGWAGHVSPFVRTPKPGKLDGHYDKGRPRWSGLNTFELAIFFYIIVTLILSIRWSDYFFTLFLVMTGTGLLLLLAEPVISQIKSVKRFPVFRGTGAQLPDELQVQKR